MLVLWRSAVRGQGGHLTSLRLGGSAGPVTCLYLPVRPSRAVTDMGVTADFRKGWLMHRT